MAVAYENGYVVIKNQGKGTVKRSHFLVKEQDIRHKPCINVGPITFPEDLIGKRVVLKWEVIPEDVPVYHYKGNANEYFDGITRRWKDLTLDT